MPVKESKYLLVVSFLEGRQFPRRTHTKLLIEAKFDGELLSTDAVEHVDTVEVNQELAWELDKKTLQMHRLQRSCIKAVCYAVNDEQHSKEMIGYIVLDVRSAPEGMGAPKWYPLLQSKYPKSKPTLQINIYVEADDSAASALPQQQSEESELRVIGRIAFFSLSCFFTLDQNETLFLFYSMNRHINRYILFTRAKIECPFFLCLVLSLLNFFGRIFSRMKS